MLGKGFCSYVDTDCDRREVSPADTGNLDSGTRTQEELLNERLFMF